MGIIKIYNFLNAISGFLGRLNESIQYEIWVKGDIFQVIFEKGYSLDKEILYNFGKIYINKYYCYYSFKSYKIKI